MLSPYLPWNAASPLRVLCLGAHSDDIEIGCGGTLLQLLAQCPGLHLTWAVFSSAGPREREATVSASRFLERAASHKLVVMNFRDGFFPYEGASIKERFEQLKKDGPFDVIFTHYREDRHQDHRVVSDLTWNTWRNHFILEYEIPKYDGDFGTPNLFVPLGEEVCRRKIQHILEVFRSESNKAWMTEDTFQAVLRLRGVECAAPEKYAEAFYCRKLVLGIQEAP